jgi:hypothetical protein
MPPRTGETLVDSVRSYNDDVRWERFDFAASHLPAPQRSQRLDEWDQRGKDLAITDYDIVKVDQKTARSAQVQIKVSWYLKSQGTLHETQAMQTWERHGKDWLIVDEARVRGTEMPGLTEPAAKDAPHEKAVAAPAP